MLTGTLVHKAVEHRLLTGSWEGVEKVLNPESLRFVKRSAAWIVKVARSQDHRMPEAKVPKGDVEHSFTLDAGDKYGLAVPLLGYIDWVEAGEARVTDHKTLKDAVYQKTQRELEGDSQAIIYGIVAKGLGVGTKLQSGPRGVTFRHLYYPTTGKAQPTYTQVELSFDYIEDKFGEVAENSHKMRDYSEISSPANVPPNFTACGDYGGCPFRGYCTQINGASVPNVGYGASPDRPGKAAKDVTTVEEALDLFDSTDADAKDGGTGGKMAPLPGSAYKGKKKAAKPNATFMDRVRDARPSDEDDVVDLADIEDDEELSEEELEALRVRTAEMAEKAAAKPSKPRRGLQPKRRKVEHPEVAKAEDADEEKPKRRKKRKPKASESGTSDVPSARDIAAAWEGHAKDHGLDTQDRNNPLATLTLGKAIEDDERKVAPVTSLLLIDCAPKVMPATRFEEWVLPIVARVEEENGATHYLLPPLDYGRGRAHIAMAVRSLAAKSNLPTCLCVDSRHPLADCVLAEIVPHYDEVVRATR